MTDIPNLAEVVNQAHSLMEDPNVLRHVSTPDEIYFNVPYKGTCVALLIPSINGIHGGCVCTLIII